jgi:hypothetical protein
MTFQLVMLAGLILITMRDDVGTKTIEGYIAFLFCFPRAWIASLQTYSAAKATLTSAGDRTGGPSSLAGDLPRPRGPSTEYCDLRVQPLVPVRRPG